MSSDGAIEPIPKQQKIAHDFFTEQKRQDVIDWDELFMGTCLLNAMRSKDPRTQVGACIVNKEKRIVGIGYNGFANGCSDDELAWSRKSETNSKLETKHLFVCHAEMNAIVNKIQADLKNTTIYVSLFPCNECAKLIIQSGIKQVIYLEDRDKEEYEASRTMFKLAGVTYKPYQPTRKEIVLKLK